MLCRIVSVGRIKEAHYRQALAEYVKRLAFYMPCEMREDLEEKYPDKGNSARIQGCLDKEGRKILDLVGSDYLLLLDVKGREIGSEQLAGRIESWNQSGIKRLNVVIGGAYGVSDAVKNRADEIISLSPMTFPHQMAVVIVAEQLYRAQTIIHGGKYHHGA